MTAMLVESARPRAEHTRPEPFSVEDYLAEVLATVEPLGVETVALEAALSRVTAEPMAAALPVPLFDNAAMDGYAVRDEDVRSSSATRPVWLRVVARAAAGSRVDTIVGRDEAVQIMTGAPVPRGADRIIPVESSVGGVFDDGPFVGVWASGRTHIRRAAEDIGIGAPLIGAGQVLGARDIGILAATGHREVQVRRRPRVAIVSTGDELTSSSSAGIPDSNSLYLAAAVQSVGAEISVRVVAPDDRADLEAILDRAARLSDLIVSSGGLGSGSHDVVRDAILSMPLSAPLSAKRGRWASVAMKPGRPQAHGTWRGVPWIALPGNPTAVLVSFESFVRPALDRLSGKTESALVEPCVVAHEWSAQAGTTRFVPLADSGCDDTASVVPAAMRSSHSIAAMFGARRLGVIGPQVESLRPGEPVMTVVPI